MASRPGPELALVALPFAGGNAGALTPLAQGLGGAVRFHGVELPGHGRRIREPLLTSIEAMAEAALAEARPYIQAGPWALFGHSMGGLVAHRLALAAREAGLPGPRRLFLSGCAAPGLAKVPPEVAELDSAAFWRMVDQYNGLPQGFLEYPELLDVFEPILRADFVAVSRYRPADLPLLDTPITVLHGREDPVPRQDLAAWQAATTHPLTWRCFAGGHFFLLREAAAVARCLLDDCRCPAV